MFRLWPNEVMLRLTLSAGDLARTRIAAGLGPFAETMLGVAALRMAPAQTAPPWHSVARGPLAGRTRDLARFLCPMPTVQLDTFSNVDHGLDLDSGVTAWMELPDAVLHDEIAVTGCRRREAAGWLNGIETGAARPRQHVADLVARLHASVVAPHWSSTRRAR